MLPDSAGRWLHTAVDKASIKAGMQVRVDFHDGMITHILCVDFV